MVYLEEIFCDCNLELVQTVFFYPGHFSLVNSQYLVEISLGNNPWSCDCQHVTQLRGWVSDNEARVVDGSKLACYMNDTNVIGQYILEESDCGSLTNTFTALTAMSDTMVIIDHLPSIIISVSVLIVLIVPSQLQVGSKIVTLVSSVR